MTDQDKQLLDQVRALFRSQALAVLSTQKNQQPYASLVAFAASDDLKRIFFLTPTTTRKYDNLITSPRVAVLVNDSRNRPDDIYRAVSVTATGTASVADSKTKATGFDFYLKKHPHLKRFAHAPTTALIDITVSRYFMVDHFQHVIEIQVNP